MRPGGQAVMASTDAGDARRLRGIAVVDWFVLVVVADGALALVQDLALGRSLPVEVMARLFLLVQVFAVLAFTRTRAAGMPVYLTAALVLGGLGMAMPLVLLLLEGAGVEFVARTFHFMFGIGFLTALAPFVPIGLVRSRVFPVFFALCMAFGAAQVVSQDLLLPETLKVLFGLQFELFSNGRLRAVGFFSSAPRFAEMLVFVMLCLFFDLVNGRRFGVLRVAVYGVALWLLYNTYSRSGYVLWITATLVAVVLARHEVLVARSVGGLLARVLAVTAFGAGAVVAVATVDPDALAISDLSSFLIRLEVWSQQVGAFVASDTVHLLFGTGAAPLFSRSEVDYYAVDNLMLILLRFGGLFGLTAFLLAYAAIFVAAARAVRDGGDRLLPPLLAFYAGLLVESSFVDNHNTIHLTQVVLIALLTARGWRKGGAGG